MEEAIFKNASTTYYWSSKFFPATVRADVFKLYSFVRIADDFVDQIPQDAEGFYELKAAYQGKKASKNPGIILAVDNINYLCDKYDLEKQWVTVFLGSMEQDTKNVTYKTLAESLEYVYGSADVVGFMMAKILGLNDAAFKAAGLQGRAMQWVNFIRDIDEDNTLGRCYFPKSDLEKLGLKDLSRESAEANPDAFKKFVHLQITRYQKWQNEAEAGYKFIPRRLRIPVKTASDMYNWTAKEIEKNPFIVFEKKVKPAKLKIICVAAGNVL